MPALSLAISPAAAQSVEEFYRGKTITMVVGTSPGGDYDLRMRMVSRHIGKHIPGNPTVVATNMPGAGQMLVANWLANVAPKDGTVIVALSQNMAVNQATGAAGVKYDVRKFNWIGNTTDSPNVINCVVHDRHQDDPGRDDSASWWSAPPAPPAARVSIPTRSTSWSAPSSRSSPAIRAATTSTSRWSAARSAAAARTPGRRGRRRGRNGWRRRRSSSWSRSALKRNPELPDIPTMQELAKNDVDKRVLTFISADTAISRPLVTNGGVPRERVEALRRAFDATMKDPRVPRRGREVEDRHQPDDRRGGAEDRREHDCHAARRSGAGERIDRRKIANARQ